MAVNKVVYGGNTLVDLTGDTVTAADLADGVKATGADGNPVIGLMQKVTIDAELSTTSTNPVQNKVIKAALDGKLGKNETAAAAVKDGAGNTISTTYASKADVSALLSTKLGVTATAYAATRDGAGNNIVDTYAKKTDISGMVKSVNGINAGYGGNVDLGIIPIAKGGTGASTAEQALRNLGVATQAEAEAGVIDDKIMTPLMVLQSILKNAPKQDLTPYAKLASPAFTGTPTAPTARKTTNNTQLATTAFVHALAGAVNNGGIIAAYLATNGYVKFANGLILQWGTFMLNNGFVYPISFSSQCYAVVILSNQNSTRYTNVGCTSKTTTKATFAVDNDGSHSYQAIAVGY